MHLKQLSIKNFRNYEKLELDFSPGINIIYGQNAQGKTNILEGIYVLGLTKSHRSFIDHSLIRNGESSAHISGILCYDSIDSKLELGFDSKKKKMKIDSLEIKKLSDYVSKMNIIIFYPDDLELVKGSPALRRRFLNTELSQLYGNYMNVLNDYNKLLKMRNEWLKKISNNESYDENYFQILTTYLIEKGITIFKMRKKFIDKINEQVSYIYETISEKKEYHLVYHPSVDFEEYNTEQMKQKMIEKFAKTEKIEKKLGTTLVGPHRDDFDFFLGNFNLKNYGSQGQQRIAILSLKLAEIKIFESYRDTSPILLLDDVFSELDGMKKSNLLEFMNQGTQIIITTTDLANIDSAILKRSKKIEIEQAKIKSIEEVK